MVGRLVAHIFPLDYFFVTTPIHYAEDYYILLIYLVY